MASSNERKGKKSKSKSWWKKPVTSPAQMPEPPTSRSVLFETLEPRVLLSADLSYGSADPAVLQYNPASGGTIELVQNNAVVSFAAASKVSDGIVNIDGNGFAPSLLTLDFGSLSGLSVALDVSLNNMSAGTTIEIDGSAGDDQISVAEDGTTTRVALTSPGLGSLTIDNPSAELILDGMGGSDSITFSSLNIPAAITAKAESLKVSAGQTLDTNGKSISLTATDEDL